MAGNDALLASLLMGQRQRRDPLEIYNSFGRQQVQAGSSTAPLGSGNPLEGIARALQGGIGGLMQGYALGKQEEQDQNNIDVLTKATTAGTPEGIAAALKGLKGNSELVIPVLGQIIQGRLDQTLAQQKAGQQLGPLMNVGGTTAPRAAVPQQGGGAAPAIDPTTLAPQGTPQPGYSLANNPGNIRATDIPWEGKGTPQNGFETFATPQAGANAQFKNFASYVQANPNITVAQAIAKWSPPNENNTNGVIRSISEATGINPGMPLAEVLKDPAMAAQLLDAQARLEKGGLPPGFSADTFLTATGGNPAGGATGGFASPDVARATAAPGVPGQIATPPAQGSGGVAMNQPGPPTAMSSPAGDQLRQRAQAAMQAGDNVMAFKFAQQAVEEDAKWATEVGKKNVDQAYADQKYQREKADEEARHQRGLQDKKDNPVYTQEQNLAHTYATRLNVAIPQLEEIVRSGNIPSNTEIAAANSKYVPEGIISDKAKEYRRVVKDILSATLRRESGASIADSEYISEAQKFIPLATDPPAVAANKIAALKQAARSIAEGTGRPTESYSFFGGVPAAGSAPSSAGTVPPPPPGFRPLR